MVSKEFFQALMELEKERKVSQDMFISTMEAGLSSAYKKETGLHRGPATHPPPPLSTKT